MESPKSTKVFDQLSGYTYSKELWWRSNESEQLVLSEGLAGK